MENSGNLSSKDNDIKLQNRLQWLEIIITILILALLTLFTYTEIFLSPYLGFSANLNTGLITSTHEEAVGYVLIDDQLLTVNGIPTQDINTSAQGNPFIQVKQGEHLHLVLLREGTLIEVDYPKPSQTHQNLIKLLSGDWILAIPFFGAGLITILFIRPRSKTRTLLILFFYSFAIWISAGSISNTGYWESSLIMRIFMWVSIPITIQLHWDFPKPFPPWKKWLNVLLYGIFGVIIILDFLGIISPSLYLIGFIISILIALTLLIIKFFRFKEIRPILRTLLSAYSLAILPILLMVGLMLIEAAPPKGNIALLGLTAIPGFYFFTAYRINLKHELRQINVAMRLYTGGILIEFGLNFLMLLVPPNTFNPTLINFLSFLTITFIMLTGFGILLIMPALANDQADLYHPAAGSLRLSANRAAAFINFLLLIAPLSLFLLLLLPGNQNVPFATILLSALSSVSITGLSVLFYKTYRNKFDQIVLGIKHPPEELIRNYARRITTSLELEPLASLLKTEVLPSLLIRESVLYYFDGHTGLKALFTTGVTENELETGEISKKIQSMPEEIIQQTLPKEMAWVQLAIPLRIESDVVGLWLFGRKDPNNIYDAEFEKDLRLLANQTTLALLNIRQRALLRALYNANVDRQEAQKTGIARDLHDVLLPSINYLVELQSNACDPIGFEEAVQQVNNMVRGIMSGLRPSSLDMGLNIALEELADEPEAQIGGKINIHTDLTTPDQPIIYDKTVELHLYRMVQQASRNALEHAQAHSIQIHGALLSDSIDLFVEDDGVGFPFNGMPDLSTLIANRHFGLANIFERAKIINATVNIDSHANQGTCVHIYWASNGNG